eukprot:37887_1
MSYQRKRKFEDGDNDRPSKRQRIEQENTTNTLKGNPFINNDDGNLNEWWNGNKQPENDIDAEEQGKNDLIDYFANIDYTITNKSFENDENEELFIKNIIIK